MTQPREEKISQGGAKNPSGGGNLPREGGKIFLPGEEEKISQGGAKNPSGGGILPREGGKIFLPGGVEKSPGGVL